MKLGNRLLAALAVSSIAQLGLSAASLAQDAYTIGATTYSRSFEFYQDIEAGMYRSLVINRAIRLDDIAKAGGDGLSGKPIALTQNPDELA